ncbi:hypothetical protein Tco_0521972 [Tanacetum coccineum]
MDLWYPKDSGFELIAYSDADHAGCRINEFEKNSRKDHSKSLQRLQLLFILKVRHIRKEMNEDSRFDDSQKK